MSLFVQRLAADVVPPAFPVGGQGRPPLPDDRNRIPGNPPPLPFIASICFINFFPPPPFIIFII